MKIKIFLLIIMSALFALAHGEDKPGPHGGHIVMPGNFHTEVVPDKDGSFHIFLLDLKFENPTIQDSSLKAQVVSGKAKTRLTCKPMGNHFHCFGKSKNRKGNLILQAARAGTSSSTDAKYTLPLKPFENSEKAATEDHSKH